MRRYPLVDLAAIHDELGDELEAAVLEVVRSQRFVGGEKVAEFERAFADYLSAANAIGVANGTDAIELSLKALNLPAGAEALVPANTFIATAVNHVENAASARNVPSARKALMNAS